MKASVIILTRNGGSLLAEVLRAVLEQETPWPFELLIVDSSSDDGSLAIPEASVARRIALPRAAFNHGETRNLAARAARGEYAVFLVQDATPADRQWLLALVEGMDSHLEAVGGYARQRARDGCDPALARRIEAWTPAGRAPVLKRINLEDYQRLSPAEQVQRVAFDNVCSIIRRRHLLEHPFPSVPFGEDLLWGRDQLLAGHALVYLPGAAVWHSHQRTFWQHLRRARVEHSVLSRSFGLRSVPDLLSLLRQATLVAASGARDGRRSLERQIAELIGQYLAGRTGD